MCIYSFICTILYWYCNLFLFFNLVFEKSIFLTYNYRQKREGMQPVCNSPERFWLPGNFTVTQKLWFFFLIVQSKCVHFLIIEFKLDCFHRKKVSVSLRLFLFKKFEMGHGCQSLKCLEWDFIENCFYFDPFSHF